MLVFFMWHLQRGLVRPTGGEGGGGGIGGQFHRVAHGRAMVIVSAAIIIVVSASAVIIAAAIVVGVAFALIAGWPAGWLACQPVQKA